MHKHINHYSLTHSQKGIWYTEQFYPGTSFGNVAGSLRVIGKADYMLMDRAFNLLLEKNDALRTRIFETADAPNQYMCDYVYSPIDFVDFSQDTNRREKAGQWLEQQSKLPFTIVDSALCYFAILRISDSETILYFKTHHLISDAWTMIMLGNQFIENYTRLKRRQEIYFEANLSYTDYIHSEQEYLNSSRFNKDKQYWNKEYSTLPELETLKNRPAVYSSIEAMRLTMHLSPGLTSTIKDFSAKERVSVFTVFMSAFASYVYRLTGKEDFNLGTVVLNRGNIREKNTAGMFISTVPFRINLGSQSSFIEFAQNMNKDWLSVLRHQKYPFDLLLEDIRSKHGNIPHLYDVVMSYQNARLSFDMANGEHQYQSKWHFCGADTAPFTIHINDRDGDGQFIIDYDYQVEVFTKQDIKRIHEHLITLIEDATKNPEKKLYDLEILNEQEKYQLLYEFNDTCIDYPRDKTIHQLFEEQAKKNSESIALVFEDQVLTYRELNEKSNQLAWLLRDKGIGRNDIVAIISKRSYLDIVAQLAVLKAGGAFLSIDPKYPEDRIAYMLSDADCKVILCNNVQITYGNVDVLDLGDSALYSDNSNNLNNINQSGDLCYVMYTSGSTGQPKGTMVQHLNLNNFCNNNKNNMYQHRMLDVGKCVIGLTPSIFDISIFEIFLTLLNGLTLVFTNESQMINGDEIADIISKYNVDVIHSTPSKILMYCDSDKFLKALSNIKIMMLGGEVFPALLYKKLRKYSDAILFNGYGPTETTIGVSFKEILNVTDITIGKPIANTQIYILDKKLKPLPVGIEGELCISGDGVGKGYLKSPALTAEKFIPNPFIKGSIIYKTGDIAKWREDGEMEYIGRIDTQVKVRGLRIELGEIETVLSSFEGIKNVVVIDIKDEKERQYIGAYYTAEANLDETEIRKHMCRKLPEYMIPNYFLRLEELPITSSGKVDRKALLLPSFEGILTRNYVAPRNEIEKKIANILCRIFGTKNIGIDHNFFTDLGGDSLTVIRFQALARKKYGIDIKIQDIYKNPTIRSLSESSSINFNKSNPKDPDIFQNNEIAFLRKGTGDKNIFFIHGGSGSIGGYANIFRDNGIELDDNFNCFAIQFNKLDGFAPISISIKELAEDYVQKIILIQPEGEYNLAAWCIGGQIIFEMANILENRHNKKVKSLLLFNSEAPKKWDMYYDFSLENEILNLKNIFGNLIHLPQGISNIQQLWGHVAKQDNKQIIQMIPEWIMESIPNSKHLKFSDIVYFINSMRSLQNARVNYYPQFITKSQVYFFYPLRDKTIEDHAYNISLWQKHCQKPVKIINVNSDEHSIFDEDINDTILKLNSILGNIDNE